MKSLMISTGLAVLAAAFSLPVHAQDYWLSDQITDCEIWSADQPEDGEMASWTGACLDGKAQGSGTLLFWDKNGVSARYTGEMRDGKIHGQGTVEMRAEGGDGYDNYTGAFEGGRPVGEGVLVSASGYRFDGELIDGVHHGRGKLTTPEGWMVRGEIKDGKVIGEGLAYYQDENSDLYFGDIENSQRQGIGILLMQSDDAYIGEFHQGAPHGNGIFEGANGYLYVGQYENGKPNGMGTAIDTERTSYQGHFIDGTLDGQVLVTTADGQQTVETWVQGRKMQ
ncbi:MORN repeat-containing protein [Labrenzia sp. PHM005]|uniref:MORN repeat-containing protein n=1 Tax=Labrenzia sp. PHM005 TaxID=2590016 RepID=UPI00143D215C|nr:hypothetical protein [Labrenzia sp. PHM005]